MTTFQIVYDNPTTVYFSGQSVTGSVVLVLKEPMKMRKIHLVFQGKANVHWTTGSGKHRRHHNIFDYYFDDKVILLGTDDNASELTLQPGSYQYPFRYNLPTNAPTSFEGIHGYVRYFAKATVDRPWRFDEECHAAFTIINNLNLNSEPFELREPCQAENEVNVSFCFTSGTVLARLGINRRCFVPGETIVCSSTVENRTNKPIKWTSTSLQQRVEFRCHRNLGRPIICTKTVGKVLNNTPVPAGQSNGWNNVAIAIPAVVPSRLDGCDIIIVKYLVEFTTSLGGGIESEIVIGTIPLFEHNNSSTVTPQWPSPAGQPQQHVGTSPPENHTTYAPCFNGPVRITDAGNLTWSPMYPMYGPTTTS